ncbi:dimer_Tnp_hAT domain-containing protein, partial [Haematococcus lacustris]
MEQLTAVTAPTSDPDETDGHVNFVLRYMCNHCQDNLAGSNKDRLKRHLLRCSKFLASTQAMNIAKTFSEIAAAIEEYKQENKEVAEPHHHLPIQSLNHLTGKICGLVTDTPSSMQKLWRLVEAAMPKVLAMGCWAHILNLFFTDVKKLPRIFEHIEEAKDIVNLFARQVTPHEWLRNQQGPNGTALVPMCATRFSSMYKMLRSLQQNKQALTNTVVMRGFDADERSKLIKAYHANLADVHYGLATVDKWFDDAS